MLQCYFLLRAHKTYLKQKVFYSTVASLSFSSRLSRNDSRSSLHRYSPHSGNFSSLCNNSSIFCNQPSPSFIYAFMLNKINQAIMNQSDAVLLFNLFNTLRASSSSWTKLSKASKTGLYPGLTNFS